MKLVSKFALGSLVIVIILFPAMVLFKPNVAKAADETNIMTQCWTKEECDATASGDVGSEWDNTSSKARTECSIEEKKLGKKAGELGFCYAKNLTDIKLQVPIPTTSGGLLTEVKGFAQYLSEFYKFFMAALAVMAVVLIMWAGFKRILAAGRAEAIKDANEAFFSAIIGLVIALLSYSLLSLVNPKLVEITELRIPKIKTEQMISKWCPYNLGTSGQLLSLDPDSGATGFRVWCGDKFIYPNTEDTCIGQWCPYGKICVFPEETAVQPVCMETLVHGKLSWNGNAYVDYMWLGIICKDGSYIRFANPALNSEDVAEQYSIYTLGDGLDQKDLLAMSLNACSGVNYPRGFIIEVEVNDDTSILSTVDDNYAIGKAGDNCTSIIPQKPPDKINWNDVSDESLFQLVDFPIAWPDLQRRTCNNAQHMNCSGEFPATVCLPDSCGALQSVVTCSINITRNRFPAR
ncbi:MAG: hypothetical protein WC575_03325 [Patescibacteria group bacterium]